MNRLVQTAGVVLAVFSFSANADDRLLYQLQDRVDQLEQRLGSSGMLTLAEDIRRLQEEIRYLRGEVERLQYENEQAKLRQREMYLDLEKRIQTLEQRPGGAVSSQPGPDISVEDIPISADIPVNNQDGSAIPQSPEDEERAYLAAFELLKQGRYQDAIRDFNTFLQRYPQGEYADNAQYWLGEAYYVSRDFPNALQSFRKLVKMHPQSTKLAGALLKIGYINYEQGEYDQARAALTRITREFPESSAAGLARQRLQRMDTEGR